MTLFGRAAGVLHLH